MLKNQHNLQKSRPKHTYFLDPGWTIQSMFKHLLKTLTHSVTTLHCLEAWTETVVTFA